jgi:hypothetical protein
MPDNLTRKLIADHLLDGEMTPGSEIAFRGQRHQRDGHPDKPGAT